MLETFVAVTPVLALGLLGGYVAWKSWSNHTYKNVSSARARLWTAIAEADERLAALDKIIAELTVTVDTTEQQLKINDACIERLVHADPFHPKIPEFRLHSTQNKIELQGVKQRLSDLLVSRSTTANDLRALKYIAECPLVA